MPQHGQTEDGVKCARLLSGDGPGPAERDVRVGPSPKALPADADVGGIDIKARDYRIEKVIPQGKDFLAGCASKRKQLGPGDAAQRFLSEGKQLRVTVEAGHVRKLKEILRAVYPQH